MGDSPGKRLASFRQSLGLSQRAFGAAIGTSHATVAFIEGDERDPSRAFLQKISDTYGVNADWLLSGHGEMLRAPGGGYEARRGSVEPADRSKPGHGDVTYAGIEYAFARRMALSISAGNGLTPIDEGEAEGVAFPVAWLRRQGINSDLAVLVSVKGDSMAPAIPDGALVLIHVAERSIASAGIYAFNLDGESYVKRIVPQSSGADGRPSAVAVLADNLAYPPIVLSGPELNRMTIVGRVRAVVAQV
ncbi:MAG: hypothetical protein B7Z02_09205 [Rhodobacterales bacterium 32-67-9]|nr:MAG: hypothetical protein B7Z02_09205 [Rhodobacterales bacterium 32-67-9]